MIGLDTNILVRYLTRDDRAQSEAARRLIEDRLTENDQGHVSLVTLAELAWVLRSRYGVEREALCDALMHVMADSRLAIQDAEAAWAALDLYRDHAADFADLLCIAVNRLHGCSRTVTFDRGAARVPGAELLT